jgi:hypothetical protein
MKTLAITAAALLFVSGCGGKAPVAPIGDTAPPTVVFIGDSITQSPLSGVQDRKVRSSHNIQRGLRRGFQGKTPTNSSHVSRRT